MRTRAFTALVLALAVGLAAAAAPFASSSPDGLSRVAADHGFEGKGRTAAVQDGSPAPGYAFPGIRDARLARGAAGFAGTLVVFAAGLAVASVARRRGPVAA